ncbi:MAG: hypothetical protein IPL26_18085 [Leptospiraceae bacterium]|nr:hypothetical protein [Leptospiraceae bacterium]
MKIFLVLFLVSFSSVIYSQDVDQPTKFVISGSMRFRGFALGRDTLLNRQNSVFPIYNPQKELSDIETKNNNILEKEIDARLTGKQSTLSPQKENLNYFDSRALINFQFFTSQYFDGLVGLQFGDITFGGRPISNADRNNPAIVGHGTGGELGQTTPVNMRTNFLYLNFNLKQYDFTSRYGIQFFSSPQGRLVFAIGSGAHLTKGIPSYKIILEGGWIRSRERSAADYDGNGFNEKRQNVNVAYAKVKMTPYTGYKLEIYSYVQSDNDQTDLFRETGNLFWYGFLNEWNLGTFNISIHGIYNHGSLKAMKIQRDLNENEIYQERKSYNISGGLWDLIFSYSYNSQIKLNLIGIGTTGRPGYSNDGVPAKYKGGGYRGLFSDFTISNIAIDFTGGYALFSANDMSGKYEVGTFANLIVWGPLELTIGYYHLYATKAPTMSINRDYNFLYGKRTSTFLGQEYNFNVRWNVLSDFQLLFRSGYFEPGDGLKALNDSRIGSYIKEAFVSAEYKF